MNTDQADAQSESSFATDEELQLRREIPSQREMELTQEFAYRMAQLGINPQDHIYASAMCMLVQTLSFVASTVARPAKG